MDTNQKGNIGEARAVVELVKLGYEVYLPFGTASSNDMVAVKDGICKRVSVKSTSIKTKSGRWEVFIRQSGSSGIKPFSNSGTDLVMVYILPEDRFVIIDASSISKNHSIRVN